MATSSCPKCSSTSFEVKEVQPTGSQFPLMFVQCSSCGTVIGTLNYYDAGYLSKVNQDKLEKIESELSRITSYVHSISQSLQKNVLKS